jgi:integrase
LGVIQISLSFLDSEADKMIRLGLKFHSHPFEAFVQLGLLHGMRLGETVGLKWGDVDFRKGTVHVRRTLAENIRTGKRSLDNTPKTRSSQREIPLSRLVLDALRQHRDRLGAIPHSERLVFTDAKGGPLRRSNSRRRVWLPLLKRAKLAGLGFRFHDTRHTAATTQLAKGTAVPTVSGMLGHASPAVTMQVYAHALPSAQREAAAKVDELFGE